MSIVRLQGEAEKALNIYYEVDTSKAPIGEGGMGRVYEGKCVDAVTKITRPVAIKFLFDGLPQHAIERARRESAIRLRNDNLVEMFGFIETETVVNGSLMAHYHVVSELLHGVALADVMNGKCTDTNGKTLAFAEQLYNDFKSDSVHFAKYVVSNILSGLVALHDAGYVHRDIDPSNIMITEDGHIKLIDFGIAKQVNKLTTNDRSLTTAGVFIGKAEYAAPELALGDTKHQNQTTDIYAIGILLYQCIVGHAPFEGTVTSVLKKQVNEKINLSIVKDKGLRDIISIATKKNQMERYQTASQMRVALENNEGLKRKLSKSAKVKFGSSILIVIVAIVGVVGFSQYTASVKQREAEKAIAATNDSLRAESQRLVQVADSKLALGSEHGEGYEIPLIDAYKSYKKALSNISGISGTDKTKNDINKKIEKAVGALNSAKQEFDAKTEEFDREGMSDVADVFRKRSDSVSSVLK